MTKLPLWRLREGLGNAHAQVIAEPDERYEAYCASSDFIREHIFPGGHLPSMGAMVEAARGTGLSGVWVRDCVCMCVSFGGGKGVLVVLPVLGGGNSDIAVGMAIAQMKTEQRLSGGAGLQLVGAHTTREGAPGIPTCGATPAPPAAPLATGPAVHEVEDIGPDYAVTLRAWRKAWEERKEEVGCRSGSDVYIICELGVMRRADICSVGACVGECVGVGVLFGRGSC